MMAYVALGERIDRATLFGIIAVFAGVGIIASGSVSGGNLTGDLLALANAAASAAYYVVLRHTPHRSLIVPSVAGFLVTAAVGWPLAPHLALDTRQIALLALSGGVILSGACALLIIGPRYLPAAEVSMLTNIEIIASPLLVWLVMGENPGSRSIAGGCVILAALVLHTLWRLRRSPA